MPNPLSPPVNQDDPRYLTELAFKQLIYGLTGKAFLLLITGDMTRLRNPSVLIRVRSQVEQPFPGAGAGNFKQRVEIELQQDIDQNPAESQEQAVRVLRQCFYRNDTDPRPNVDLANRLTSAISIPYTCKGILYVDEGPVEVDSQVRVNAWRILFDAFVIPNR